MSVFVARAIVFIPVFFLTNYPLVVSVCFNELICA
jgi:hypothetical protein